MFYVEGFCRFYILIVSGLTELYNDWEHVGILALIV